MALSRILVFVVLAGLLATSSGCSDAEGAGPASRAVGARCASDADCAKRCVTSNDFPGGYCTNSCASDSQCPSGSACLTLEGGICVGLCQVAADCNGYGPGYECNLYGRVAGGDRVRACAGASAGAAP